MWPHRPRPLYHDDDGVKGGRKAMVVSKWWKQTAGMIDHHRRRRLRGFLLFSYRCFEWKTKSKLITNVDVKGKGGVAQTIYIYIIIIYRYAYIRHVSVGAPFDAPTVIVVYAYLQYGWAQHRKSAVYYKLLSSPTDGGVQQTLVSRIIDILRRSGKRDLRSRGRSVPGRAHIIYTIGRRHKRWKRDTALDIFI